MEIKEIRESLLTKRRALSAEFIKEKSLRMTDDILQNPHYQACKYLYVYSPINNEIDTNYLIVKALQDEKIVCLPTILTKGDMVFCQINKTSQYRINKFNIIEPNLETKTIVDKPGVMIVPLVGFYKNYRLGYGKQYYNNYLANRLDTLFTIGVAYDFQRCDAFPITDKDVPLNEIRTY